VPAEKARHRGQDVRELGRRLDRLAGPRAARQLHQQGHAQRFRVEQDRVLVLAVLAEALAVVGVKMTSARS
jgi:hypothetical protein